MIEVISTGIYTSIQDQGRFGFRNIGIPVSGVMDRFSANLANILLNNNKRCAVLETTFIGPILKFHQDTFIAVTGAKCLLKINDIPIDLNSVHAVFKGDILNIGKATTGIRNYLAVAGGFKTQLVLNSRSYYNGISEYKTLVKGMSIIISKQNSPIINRTKVTPIQDHSNFSTLKATKGPEFDILNQKSKDVLCHHKFNISSQCNRMAYPLDSINSLTANEIITSSVQPGTVQLTPSGKVIILMRDCQTTGGYSRVLQLTNSSINQLAQKRPNDSVFFAI